jgi:hypothetical protein
MKSLPVRSGESIGLSLPLVELTKHSRIAVERGEAPAVFEDRLRQEVGVEAARIRKIESLKADEGVEEFTNAVVNIQPLFEGSETENIFGIFQALMCNVAHKVENDSDIAVVDVSLVLHALADQPQNFQAAVNYLVLSRACRGRQHAKPPSF